MSRFHEINFDGLVGPTHNFAGLSFGNVASSSNRNRASSPRSAALQGLKKMQFVAGLGVQQAVLPPLHRPDLKFLHHLGFRGTPRQMLESAWKANPVWVACCYSASNMWTANAATVSPSPDTSDSRLHLTPANLSSTLHRSIEPKSTFRVLSAIFNGKHFEVHPPLESCDALSDEGAANHTRLGPSHQGKCFEMFVYGREALNKSALTPSKFPARQTLESCQAIARRHGLDSNFCFYFQQTPTAIDAGVFHNDVISVGNENVLLVHELAFVNQALGLSDLKRRFESEFEQELFVVEFSDAEVPLKDAVQSYLFNSQLVSRPDGGMTLVCPLEAQENPNSFAATERLIAEPNPVDSVEFLELRQSMNNGGGPACLRLRVAMSEAEQATLHQGVLFNESLSEKLTNWIETHYRDELSPADLADPQLMDETASATESLMQILELPGDVTGCLD